MGIQCVLSKQPLPVPQKNLDFKTQCFYVAYQYGIMSPNLEVSAEVGTGSTDFLIHGTSPDCVVIFPYNQFQTCLLTLFNDFAF